MASEKSGETTGMGFLSWLLLIFVGMKLAGVGAVARWSWWWVMAPLWIPFAICLALLPFLFLYFWARDRR
jgi:hypothetical protein